MPVCSISTPSHSVKYLSRLAQSIQEQTALKWLDVQWVILANGESPDSEFHSSVSQLVRGIDLKVVRANPQLPKTIGSFKRQANLACSGDFIVEADHDDLLAPDCLDEVAKAFRRGADFVWSNMAIFTDERNSKDVWPEYVDTRPCRLFGMDLLEGISEFIPHTILNAGAKAPCHVRAWTRELYHLVGGHNPEISWTEDLEFLCRVYLTTDKLAKIEKPLYAYYVAPPEERRQASLEIREEHHKWIPELAPRVARRWCERNGYRVVTKVHELDGDGIGLIELDDEAANYPQRETINRAWKALVHGGFFFASVSSVWHPGPCNDTFKPGEQDECRFQPLRAEFYTPLQLRGVRCIAIADKGGPPLPGMNHWRPRLNASYLPKIKSILETYGVSIRFADDRAYVSGQRANEAVVFLNAMRPGCFVEEQ